MRELRNIRSCPNTNRLSELDNLHASGILDSDQYGVVTAVYQLLRQQLDYDLTRNQYIHIFNDAKRYWLNYLLRNEQNAKAAAMMSWTIHQYMLCKYFTAGLFLDDIRVVGDLCNYLDEIAILPYLLGKWTVVRTYEDFVQRITMDDSYRRVSLDHDLGEDPNGQELPSGYDAIKWLVEYILDENHPIPEVFCHSQNPVGKANIMGYWQSFQNSGGKS
ncbi:cyclic-phosphate processing receiver domain-containing protein [Sphingobacterium faecale]|uniref:Cyclic-phosphate processing Receiver domain-containing protein n=1 Tax=Sphingobacterium faecale TaxID=2803775 RepID=A0ABS1R1Y1_9SPHI|nr:cyclic-phosphate processing receiver domain-containing protein [Sphingobacterium faecale]MBL1408709.1 hypothetical protein [Sphingobacterium faecale]